MFYLYKNGVYKLITDIEISKLLRDFLHSYVVDKWTACVENTYIEALKRDALTFDSTDTDKSIINLKNGFLDINTMELRPHDPSILSTIQLPFDYDKDAVCPKFERFLYEICNGDEELIRIVKQMLGYCLTAEVKAQTAFIFFGKGSNGKSVLLKVLVRLCGKGNYSTLSLCDLSDSFDRFNLVNKTINISTESESSKKGLSSQYLKAIITGDPVRVEIKYGASFDYDPYCKMLFAMNKLPKFEESDEGIERRFIIIPFLRKFKGKDDNKNLLEELLEELPGIFNLSVEGLLELRKNNFTFPECEATKEGQTKYLAKNNPFKLYVNQYIENVDMVNKTSYKELTDHFNEWCETQGLDTLTDINHNLFIEKIKETFNDLDYTYRSGKTNGGYRHFWGIGLKKIRDT